MMKYYTWKEIKNEEWDKGIFNTIDECIEDAKLSNISSNIYICEIEPYKHYIDANDILENIENVAYEDFNIDFEFYIDDTKVQTLSKKLTDVLSNWLEENKQQLNFYYIKEDTIQFVEMIKERKTVKMTFSIDDEEIGHAYYKTDEDNLLSIESALKNFKISTEIENDCSLLYNKSDDLWYFNNINIGYYNTEELIGLISKIEIINNL